MNLSNVKRPNTPEDLEIFATITQEPTNKVIGWLAIDSEETCWIHLKKGVRHTRVSWNQIGDIGRTIQYIGNLYNCKIVLD